MFTAPEKPEQKTVFFSHLYIKMNILPRQARDKHREKHSKNDRLSSMQRPKRVVVQLFPDIDVCPEPVLAKRSAFGRHKKGGLFSAAAGGSST
jgi:hypothetical protein